MKRCHLSRTVYVPLLNVDCLCCMDLQTSNSILPPARQSLEDIMLLVWSVHKILTR